MRAEKMKFTLRLRLPAHSGNILLASLQRHRRKLLTLSNYPSRLKHIRSRSCSDFDQSISAHFSPKNVHSKWPFSSHYAHYRFADVGHDDALASQQGYILNDQWLEFFTLPENLTLSWMLRANKTTVE